EGAEAGLRTAGPTEEEKANTAAEMAERRMRVDPWAGLVVAVGAAVGQRSESERPAVVVVIQEAVVPPTTAPAAAAGAIWIPGQRAPSARATAAAAMARSRSPRLS